ncbi:SH3-domain GRB2-like 3, isoform CRA_d [Rattus norvegicus]|uniref:SH3-domain GRB2-like 3, isoform CRA_d n=1 Tax=Rattus norvegicus TaxID=10116 RepID=A6JCJ5_RAT|nr:SH3-domain GRB2-like 3, isoform CRA_d [Rattus norvegicus]
MSVAGLKKQFHKASQLFSEKISGAEGTKLDEEFLDMEKVLTFPRTSPAVVVSMTLSQKTKENWDLKKGTSLH